MSDETVFPVEIRLLEPAETPPVVVYSPKLTAPGGLVSDNIRESRSSD
jgi:hypothetical protein